MTQLVFRLANYTGIVSGDTITVQPGWTFAPGVNEGAQQAINTVLSNYSTFTVGMIDTTYGIRTVPFQHTSGAGSPQANVIGCVSISS